METQLTPYRDPEIAEVVAALTQDLADIPGQIESIQALAARGLTRGEALGLQPEHYAALYEMAERLCNEGEFAHALPIAMQLALNQARDPRYFFIAGTCLQRLGHPQDAAAMYGLCLLADTSHVAAMFRMGECLNATSQRESAIAAFEHAFDLGRADSSYRHIQDMAQEQLSILRRAA